MNKEKIGATIIINKFLERSEARKCQDTINLIECGSSLILPALHISHTKNRHFRMRNFYETWLDHYLDEDFFMHFRMYSKTFESLFEEVERCRLKLRPCLRLKDIKQPGFPEVAPKKGLLLTIWYLAKGDTLVSTADRFDIAISSAHKITNANISIICSITKDFIKWPVEMEMETLAAEFALHGYPDVIGAIDGCHIMCNVPAEQHDSYANRKSQHSIVLQGICTSKKLFTNVFIGFPGSAHDARIFKESQFYRNVQAHGSNKYFADKYHLLGDSAYPCLEWLMTPYRNTGHLTRIQRHHNYIHSSSRVCIEHSYGLLKQRWRILKYVNAYSIKKVIKIVAACCTLHNFCLIKKDLYSIDYDEAVVRVDAAEQIPVIRQGNNKRNAIANLISNNQI